MLHKCITLHYTTQFSISILQYSVLMLIIIHKRTFTIKFYIVKNKSIREMSVALEFGCRALLLVCVFSCLVVAQRDGDVDSISPPECGHSYRQTKPPSKRYTSGTVSDQKEWGWHVLVINHDRFMYSGSLINSQWVLFRASDSK
jgi:hypothetical protein